MRQECGMNAGRNKTDAEADAEMRPFAFMHCFFILARSSFPIELLFESLTHKAETWAGGIVFVIPRVGRVEISEAKANYDLPVLCKHKLVA